MGLKGRHDSFKEFYPVSFLGVVGAGGHGWALPRGLACPCGWQPAAAATSTVRSLQLREHVFWSCTGAQVIRRTLEHNLPEGVPLLPQHVWLLEPPSASSQAEVWIAVGLASLAAMLKARNLYFREFPSAGHTLGKSRALELLSGALQDFATCQGCRSCLSDLGPAHPIV